MTTLVTGASGFLGGVLARKLVERGDRVRVLVRPSSDRSALQDLDVEFVTGDVTDRGSLDAAAAGCDRVFHSAALVKTWLRDRSQYARVNVEGTCNVIEAALDAGVSRIVYTSSFLVLKPGDHLITEESRASEDEVWAEYSRTKWLAHKEVDRFVADGAPIVIVYPGVIFGPGKLTEGNLVVNWMVRFFQGKFPGFLGRGEARWSLSFVDDVAQGHLLADEKGALGRGYCLGGENVSARRLMEMVAEATNREPPTRCVPFWLAKFVGLLQEGWATLTGREPELTRTVVETFRNNWALDSSRARSELGYQPTPLKQAVEKTIAWLRSEGLIEPPL